MSPKVGQRWLWFYKSKMWDSLVIVEIEEVTFSCVYFSTVQIINSKGPRDFCEKIGDYTGRTIDNFDGKQSTTISIGESITEQMTYLKGQDAPCALDRARVSG